MAVVLSVSKTSAPVGTLLLTEYVRPVLPVNFIWEKDFSLKINNDLVLTCPSSCNRYFARCSGSLNLYGSSLLERTEVDHWISFASGLKGSDEDLSKIEKALFMATFLVGENITAADLVLWGSLFVSGQCHLRNQDSNQYVNIKRWYKLIESQELVKKVVKNLPEDVKITSRTSPNHGSSTSTRKEEGKFVDLPGAEEGKVVVRFPPEASGYLHIGHAKAALLNQYYQQLFKGTLIMRFDDTNPAKENAEFEKVILEDLEMLQIKYDKLTHTSDHFDLIERYCEQMLKEGKAYIDDTDPETMKQERDQKLESKNRVNSVDKNFALWKEMKNGTDIGLKCCVRAKIDMQSVNGCMRDPTMYRCKPEPHVRTGYKYKIYPTYDFACPIVDSIEGVTHALRTTEYHDRDDQYYWFIEALNLRKPYIWEYARLSMINTVLSKRKLTWFVQNGHVDGWDDPRFPTVRGVLRHGMTVEGLKQFIIAQGSSRSVVQMEWDKIWSFNKKIIDPIAPRYTALERNTVKVHVRGVKETCVTAALHPKNPDVGSKEVWMSDQVLIDLADVESLRVGENATFINWGNLRIVSINKGKDSVSVEAEPNLDDKDYKKTPKLTWISNTEKARPIPCVSVFFDHIISKPVLAKDEDFKQYINTNTRTEVLMLGDPELIKVKKGDIIQLQRRGFFICDSPYEPISTHSCREAPIILFSIPDGSKPVEPAKTTTVASSKKAVNSEISKPKEVEKAAVQTKEVDVKSLHEQVQTQGEKVRDLKANKADKTQIDTAVKELLALKSKFKLATGMEWKADSAIPSQVEKQDNDSTLNVDKLDAAIKACGDQVRDLKAKKADKGEIDAAVKELLSLKASFKSSFGVEWGPNVAFSLAPANAPISTPTSTNQDSLSIQIKECGDKVRDLKAKKAEKAEIDSAVKALLTLKSSYKALTGVEWNPNLVPAPANKLAPTPVATSGTSDSLSVQITECGNKVRDLKANKAAKGEIDTAVKELLSLKATYKATTGLEWKPTTTTENKSAVDAAVKKEAPVKKMEKEKKQEPKSKEKKTEAKNSEETSSGLKKQTRLGLEAKKDENLAEWYSQVITKAEMIEYYDVSGCYILRPWAYAIWESIKDFFDAEIKKLGVQNCYFPMFVSHHALEKEKTHIADFAPEVAWVTKSGNSDLAEPIAIRPTSETVMYPAYAKWIQSHRDLPLKLNQWNNVVRWEFKHPQPFLRTREFLWQEGHTAFATAKEAEEEVFQILELYSQVYTDLMAIPVIKGRKTEKEKFAGGDFTTTVEAFIAASGRGIQGATSHHLGQNFSKMFEIVIEDPETKEKKHIYQNSWGLTTRTIGVMVMVHSDDKGLVLPPNVASIQVVIVPCGINVNVSEEEKNNLMTACQEYEKVLSAAGIRVKGDYRDNYSPGWKFNHWELKGVPLRVEIGPRDVKQGEYVAVRRDTSEKLTKSMASAAGDIKQLLDTIQKALLDKATQELESHTVVVENFGDFISQLDKKNIILSPFCGEGSCEEKIKKESTRDDGADPGAPAMGAKSLCIPFKQPAELKVDAKCVYPGCSNKPKYYCLFGRSY
ncbi:bifunctional glutamate/proline--tRNA ligase-like isoform X1 [Daphnia pulicaria]|uniref:bifunctional glutamate/proline--tRNA ligase-like isoform X1 n=1 Tax=Daphnia pulicaria TaxID=35523 RepID=UPI001EEAE1A1|nr:bifunctional glutamate/proline--tRNA ligase-like isoform X1 [Daphnia pulicaria]